MVAYKPAGIQKFTGDPWTTFTKAVGASSSDMNFMVLRSHWKLESQTIYKKKCIYYIHFLKFILLIVLITNYLIQETNQKCIAIIQVSNDQDLN